MSLAARPVSTGEHGRPLAAVGSGSVPAAAGELVERVEMLQSVNASLRRTVARLQGEVAVTRRLAYHDTLTGLPNRYLLRDRLEQGVRRAAREGHRIALLLLDLDQFKAVNDTLGHEAGDELLREVAARLRACTRGADTVCRWGGDEFVVMLPNVFGAGEAEYVAEKIRACLMAPFRLGGEVVRIGVSLGVAMLDPGDRAVERLIRDADRAMYRAKRAARAATPSRTVITATATATAAETRMC
ncbi:MAG: GGDEF domain-containing protein [Gammaproteobacteria bacterium]|nr:GGDEF domain-containing protein [Gammaproteobacteria bacterium]